MQGLFASIAAVDRARGRTRAVAAEKGRDASSHTAIESSDAYPRKPAVWLKYCAASGCLTMIVAEQATQAFMPHYLARLTTLFSFRGDDVVTEALMIPLGKIMHVISLDHIGQRLFA